MKNTNKSLIIKSCIATVVLLLVFFVQGAVVVINKIEGVKSALIRGGIIWGLVAVTLLYFLLRYKSLSVIGFVKVRKGTARRVLFYIPMIAIALSHFVTGFDFSNNSDVFLANLFLTLAIGMSEEIFFRGIICNIWLERGLIKAMLISAILFGSCHLLNMAGGAELGATILQICFAFVYGMVFAVIFAAGKSIIPCVLLHAMHDFCSFISPDCTGTVNIVIGASQFVILTAYLVFLLKRKDDIL